MRMVAIQYESIKQRLQGERQEDVDILRVQNVGLILVDIIYMIDTA